MPVFCHNCWDLKPREAFGRNPAMRSGYLKQCKDCRRAWARSYRESNRDAIRAKQLEWERRPDVRDRAQARLQAWRLRFPERRAAQTALNNAIRDGRVKQQPCWVCGKTAEAHHPDYSQPLDVVWLCVGHHRAAHRAAEDC